MPLHLKEMRWNYSSPIVAHPGVDRIGISPKISTQIGICVKIPYSYLLQDYHIYLHIIMMIYGNKNRYSGANRYLVDSSTMVSPRTKPQDSKPGLQQRKATSDAPSSVTHPTSWLIFSSQTQSQPPIASMVEQPWIIINHHKSMNIWNHQPWVKKSSIFLARFLPCAPKHPNVQSSQSFWSRLSSWSKYLGGFFHQLHIYLNMILVEFLS